MGFTEYHVVTNLSPYGGSCSVSPHRGVATFNTYVISCANWKDESLGVSRDYNVDKLRQDELYYTYFSRPQGADAAYTMVHFGPDATTPELNLAMGYKSADYAVDLLVSVADSFGESTDYTLEVQVGYGKITRQSMIHTRLIEFSLCVFVIQFQVGEFYIKYDELLSKINGDVTNFDFQFASQDVRAITNTVESLVEQLDRRKEVQHTGNI